jgi:predicted NAD-dependent protein-ADP-ribosyltransferase YbiA (DUF1768 family)
MCESLAAKFAVGSALAAQLVATEPLRLIENAPRDKLWGAGAKGDGANTLGVLLEELRAERAALNRLNR